MKMTIPNFPAAGVAVILVALHGLAAGAQLTKLPAKEGVKGQTANTGDSVKQLKEAPANFSAPLYKSNVESTNFSELVSKNGSTTRALIKTSDPADVAFSWYQTALSSSGWEVELPKPGLAAAGNFMLKAHKGDQAIFISCFHLAKLNATIVNVSATAQ